MIISAVNIIVTQASDARVSYKLHHSRVGPVLPAILLSVPITSATLNRTAVLFCCLFF